MNLYETKKKYLRVVRIWCFQQMMLRHKRSMPKQGDSMQNFFQLLYGLPKHTKWCDKNQNRDSNPGANFSVVARTCWGLQLSQSLFVPFWDWKKLRFDKIQTIISRNNMLKVQICTMYLLTTFYNVLFDKTMHNQKPATGWTFMCFNLMLLGENDLDKYD